MPIIFNTIPSSYNTYKYTRNYFRDWVLPLNPFLWPRGGICC